MDSWNLSFVCTVPTKYKLSGIVSGEGNRRIIVQTVEIEDMCGLPPFQSYCLLPTSSTH